MAITKNHIKNVFGTPSGEINEASNIIENAPTTKTANQGIAVNNKSLTLVNVTKIAAIKSDTNTLIQILSPRISLLFNIAAKITTTTKKAKIGAKTETADTSAPALVATSVTIWYVILMFSKTSSQ